MSENSSARKPLVRILLLEDDVDMQELMIKTFKPNNYEFVVYSDPSEAMSRANAEKGFLDQFDLVITDLRMPKISGLEFITHFKKSGATAPIILMTATNKTELAVEAIRAGAYDFIVKPVNFSQLALSIERALDLNQLKRQNESLRSSIKGSWTFEGIVGKSAAIQQVFELAKKVARSSANVLIQGESGTGKEVIARAIHNCSERVKAPYIAINCSAIPESLLESELFGHAKGSFTGATEKKTGLFEEAEGGTLFLDEIGDLNLPLQAKLLRVIQERKIKRIGENAERPINVRILAATHKDLKEEVKEGRFREDLFFRLNVIQLKIPPLRARKDDLLPLAEYFLKRFKAQNQSPVQGFSRTAVEHMWKHPWPGNVRELENAVERAVILASGGLIEAEDLKQFDDAPEASADPANSRPVAKSAGHLQFVVDFADNRLLPLEDICRQYARYVVDASGGVKEKAVRILEIDRKTLYRKLADHAERANHAGDGAAKLPAPPAQPAAVSTYPKELTH